MKNKNIINLTLTAVLLSIIFVMGATPYIGFITIPTGAVTLLHIPATLGMLILPLGYAILIGIGFGMSSLIAAFLYATGPIDLAAQNPLISVLPRFLMGIIVFAIFYGYKLLVNKYKHGVKISYIITGLILLVILGVSIYNVINVNSTSTVLAVIEIIAVTVLIATFLYMIIKFKDKKAYIANCFFIGTLVNTALFISAVAIFKIDALTDPNVFGEDVTFIQVVISLVLGNAMLEAILAVFVGTPLYLALNKNILERGK